MAALRACPPLPTSLSPQQWLQLLGLASAPPQKACVSPVTPRFSWRTPGQHREHQPRPGRLCLPPAPAATPAAGCRPCCHLGGQGSRRTTSATPTTPVLASFHGYSLLHPPNPKRNPSAQRVSLTSLLTVNTSSEGNTHQKITALEKLDLHNLLIHDEHAATFWDNLDPFSITDILVSAEVFLYHTRNFFQEKSKKTLSSSTLHLDHLFCISPITDSIYQLFTAHLVLSFLPQTPNTFSL